MASENKIIYVIAFILVAFLSLGMVSNHVLFNNDSIGWMGGSSDYNKIYLMSGRFIIPFFANLLYKNEMLPINIFFFTSCIFIWLTMLICKMFNIKSFFYTITIAILIFAFPLVSFFYGYGHTITSYAAALLLAVYAVYFLMKNEAKASLVGMLCIVISLGIYQIFISVTVAMVILFFFMEYSDKDFVSTIKIFIKTMFLILCAIITYYIIMKLILHYFDLSVTSYQGANKLSISAIIKSLPTMIVYSYKEFFSFLKSDTFYFNTEFNYAFIYVLCLLPYIYWAFKKYKNPVLIIILFFALFIPAMYLNNIMTLVKTQYTEYGLLVFLIGTVIILSRFEYKKNSSIIIVLLVVFYSFNSISQVNQEFLKMIQFNKVSEEIAFKIKMDLAATDGYTKDSKVMFINSFQRNDYLGESYSKPFNNRNYIVVKPPGYKDTNFNRDPYFLIEFLGFGINKEYMYKSTPLTDEAKAKVEEMAYFPKDGYIQCIDDVYYVKLGYSKE